MKYDVDSMFGIKGEVAIIVGASRGIGKEIAVAMGSLGARLALVSSGVESLNKALEEVRALGYEAIAVQADIVDKESVKSMARKVYDHYGKIDILVNCAAVAILEEAVSFDEEKWEYVMDVNVKGTMLTCQAVGKYMVEQKKGRIVNYSSVRGVQGRAKYLGYATSKGAVDTMTKTLAVEWAKDNVNVNAIAPTFTLTDINKSILDDKKTYEWVVGRIPKGRLCETRLLVGPTIFLCSPCSEFITGQILYVDGGWTIS